MNPPWRSLVRDAEKHAEDLAPWPYYYEFRAKELAEALAALACPRSWSCAVDVGCGVGFHAGLLAQDAQRVIAIDLPHADPRSHAIGLLRAQELQRRLRLPIELVAGDAVDLPLSDGSVDFLLSAYVLEHVQGRARACAEIARALTDEGEALLLLPGAMERVWAPLWYYPHTFREILCSLRQRHRASDNSERLVPTGEAPETGRGSGWRQRWQRFRRRYPHLPGVPPHGDYVSSWAELRASRAAAWRQLLEEAGLEIVEQRASMIIPVALVEEISPRLRDQLAGSLAPLVRRWGGTRWLRALAHGNLWRVRRANPHQPKPHDELQTMGPEVSCT